MFTCSTHWHDPAMSGDPKDKLRQLLEQRDARADQREQERNEAHQRDLAATKAFVELCANVIEPTIEALTTELLTPRGIRVETEKVEGGRSIAFFVFNKGAKRPADYELPKTPRLEFSVTSRPTVIVQTMLGAADPQVMSRSSKSNVESGPPSAITSDRVTELFTKLVEMSLPPVF
jgi:hypothetical protein